MGVLQGDLGLLPQWRTLKEAQARTFFTMAANPAISKLVVAGLMSGSVQMDKTSKMCLRRAGGDR